jgi:hypothetical protein
VDHDNGDDHDWMGFDRDDHGHCPIMTLNHLPNHLNGDRPVIVNALSPLNLAGNYLADGHLGKVRRNRNQFKLRSPYSRDKTGLARLEMARLR